MLLVLIEQAERLEEAPLIGRTEAQQRVEETQREVEAAGELRYAFFLFDAGRAWPGSLPVRPTRSRSSQDSR